MSARKERKAREAHQRALAAWADQTRAEATSHACELALIIATGGEHAANAYHIGAVLDDGEIVWGRGASQFRSSAKDEPWLERGYAQWAITSHRLIGRRADGGLEHIPWSAIVGVRVDLPAEWVALDAGNGWRAVLTGPAIAPIAVAAVAACHGTLAMIDHPGLEPLRVRATVEASSAGLRYEFGGTHWGEHG